MEMKCEDHASCAPGVYHSETCFCDRLCRVYDDCCRDYFDEEGDRQLTPLPPSSFTCSLMVPYPIYIYIITECPPTYDVQFVRDNCRRGSATARPPSSETFYVVPVSSRTSGLVYRNVYCAVCHGEDDVGFWSVKTRNCNEPESAGVRDTIDEMRQQSFDGCTFFFSPVSDVPLPRRCVDSVVTCPDDANAEVASRCALSSNVAYVYNRLDDTAYRNRDCAECHGVKDHDLSCNSSRKKLVPERGFESFAIVLDINTGTGSVVRKVSGTITQTLASCPQRHVYDPFTGNCRMITCPPGHSFTENDQCQSHPIYQTPTTNITELEVVRKNTTFGDQTDDYDCAWIQFNSSEYQVLLNRSIYVRLHDATYDSYRLGENQTAYVCTPFQRNYTATIHEALRVDAVGAYLSLVCSVISLVALAFQFAVYMAFPSLRNTPGRCIICLVVSLFVGQLLFLLVKTGSSVSFGFCFGQAAVMHFAFLAAFFWMNVMAFDIHRTFGASPGAIASFSSPSGARRRFAGYSAYVWVSAAVVVAVGVAMDLADVGGTYRPHYGYRICWFGSRGGLLVLFGVPVGVLLVVNIILFSLSIRQIRSACKASQLAVQNTDQTPLLVSNLIVG